MIKKIGFISLLIFSVSFSLTIVAQDYIGIERDLKKHVLTLTADSLMGRKAGSIGEQRAANYIYDVLHSSGLTMLAPKEGQDFFIAGENGDTLHSRNVLGVVEGYDPKLKNEYIVVGAHFDHLGTHTIKVNGKDSTVIYRGADDNASGVAIMMELAKQISTQSYLFKRSVIFIAFGAEEIGLAGSWYFLNRAFSESNNIMMMVNLDMLGRSGGNNKFKIFTAAPNVEINLILQTLYREPLMVRPILADGDILPSDYISFYDKKIAVANFTTGSHREYHTPKDNPNLLDYNQMEAISQYIYAFVKEVANGDIQKNSSIYSLGTEGEEDIYSSYDIDKAPQFLHGSEEVFLNRWVYSYLKYPDYAISSGLQGKVVVEFIIEKDGSVTNVKIVRGLDDGLDAEVLKVVSASPKWKPGTLGKKKVRVKIAIPVEFKLR